MRTVAGYRRAGGRPGIGRHRAITGPCNLNAVVVALGVVVVVLAASLLPRSAGPGRVATRQARRDLGGMLMACAAAESAGYRVREVGTHARKGHRVVAVGRVVTSAVVVLALIYAAIERPPAVIPALVITAALSPSFLSTRTAYRLRSVGGTVETARQLRRGRRAVAAGVILLFLGATAVVWAVERGLDNGVLVPVGAAFAGLLLAALSVRIVHRGRRRALRHQAARFGVDTEPTDILLLRSFADDDLRMRTVDPELGHLSFLLGRHPRFEELVAAALDGHDQLIAIGRPGEPLPELGAARVYLPDDRWQEAVRDTAARCGSVVFVAGGSAGLRWELDLVAGLGLAGKTLLLVPPIDRDSAHAVVKESLRGLGISVGVEWEGVDALLPYLTAVGVSATGCPVFYVGACRDWSSYFATIVHFHGINDGRVSPPEHGHIAVLFDDAVDLTPQ